MDAGHAEPLLRHDHVGVARLVLNRPQARNALSLALMAALQRELDAIAADSAVRVVVIAGAGPVFCAGHDLKELRADPRRAAYEAVFEHCSALMQAIVALPQPVIAEVHGVATSWQPAAVATCDLAVAAETARFATPGVNIGLFCSTPMVALARNVGRKQAMEMLLLGELVDAATALRLGLVNRVVPDAGLRAATDAMAAAIVGKSPLTLKLGKAAFYRQLEQGLADAYAYTARVMTENMLARDAAEGIDAFIERRPPVWEGR
jgi:enoyl-CoA hydratase/carnithine racemase